MSNEDQQSADHPVTPDEAEEMVAEGAPTEPGIGRAEDAVDESAAPTQGSATTAPAFEDAVVAAKISELEELAAERTADLQRLQAEYANYKKRVDRDRSLARQGGVEAVVLDLLPVLDSIEAAREHDELTGGFKLVAEELERLTAKYGLTVYGEVGETFDPNVHEALMQLPMAGVEVTTVSAVMQKGVRLNDRVLRPARVGVAEPE
nr:nucleotide exchange factor GrpE [Micropruina sp. KQZ13P-5]